MRTYGLIHQLLGMVSVVQREWAAKNPRATFKAPITIEDVLNSRMIAYPFRLLQCCLMTDGGAKVPMGEFGLARPSKPLHKFLADFTLRRLAFEGVPVAVILKGAQRNSGRIGYQNESLIRASGDPQMW